MQYAAIVSYVGTSFCGFQIQPNVRTVQGTLTEAFSRLFGVRCDVSGCSRTDSGVHALASCVSVRPADGAHRIPPEKIPQAIAPFLPWDLCVKQVFAVPDTFHIRHDVLKKRYRYLLHTAPVRDPFSVGRAWQFPYPFPDGALERMREAASALVGRHDFAAFMSSGSDVPSTIRTVYDLSVLKDENGFVFSVEADGFLYNMVRIIVGTLVDVGMGRIVPQQIPAILDSGERKCAGETAPPEGLYLEKVWYRTPENNANRSTVSDAY